MSTRKVLETETLVNDIVSAHRDATEYRMRNASRHNADGPHKLTGRLAEKLKPRARPGTRRNLRHGRY